MAEVQLSELQRLEFKEAFQEFDKVIFFLNFALRFDIFLKFMNLGDKNKLCFLQNGKLIYNEA